MNIREELLLLADEEYKEFNKKLCPDTKREMLGIRIPKIRELAKKFLKENTLHEALNQINDDYFEEILLEGILIGYAKLNFEDKIKYIQNFVSKIDSWAISDTFVPTLKLKEKDLEFAWNFILPYTNSTKEFEVRFAVIMMLDYFINDEYIDKVFNELDKIKHNGYYVKMGVAWTIAESMIYYRDKTIEYLKNNNLDKFTFNKSIQKMIESRRISNEDKAMLRIMKVK